MRKLLISLCAVLLLASMAAPTQAASIVMYYPASMLPLPDGQGNSVLWVGGITSDRTYAMLTLNDSLQTLSTLNGEVALSVYNTTTKRMLVRTVNALWSLLNPDTHDTQALDRSTTNSWIAIPVDATFWLASPDWIKIIDGTTGSLLQAIGLTGSLNPYGAFAVTNQTVWVGCHDYASMNCMLAIDRKTQQTKKYTLNQLTPPFSIGVASTPDGTIYAESQGVVYRYDPSTDNFVSLNISGLLTTGMDTNELWTDINGHLWVAKRSNTNTVIAQLDPTAGTITQKLTLPDVYPAVVYDPYRDRLWVLNKNYNQIAVADATHGIAEKDPPTGTISLPASTTSLTIQLTLSAQDDTAVTDMQLANTPDFTGATWQPYATGATWQLPSGDGQKTVYARFRDPFGNVSDTVSASTTLHEIQAITEQEPNNSIATATPVPVTIRTSDLSGTILSDGDTDFFSITATVDATLIAQTSDPTLSLAILDNQGNVLTQGAGPSSPANIGVPISAGQTVYVRISGPATTKYTVRINLLNSDQHGPSIAIQTPQDRSTVTGIVQAQALPRDTSVPIWKVMWQIDNTPAATNASAPYTFTWDSTKATNGDHTITAVAYNAMGNQSQSTVHVTVNNTPPAVSASLSPSTPTTTVTLQVSAQGSQPGPVEIQVANAADFTGATWQPNQPTLSWTLPPGDGPKTVYVRARDKAGNVSQPVTAQTVLDSQHEPDDTMDQAAPLAIGTEMTGRIAIPSDVDFFRLQPTAAGWLQISLSGTAASLDVLGADGKVLCSGSPCSVPAPAGQTYYAKVSGGADPNTDYHIRATLAPPANDTPDTATPLPIPGNLSGQLNGPGDHRLYRLHPGDSGRLSVQFNPPASLGATFTLLDSAGTPLTPAQDGTFAVTKGSTYYCRVQGTGWSPTDTYQIATSLTIPPPPPPATGTSLNSALPLTLGTQSGTMPGDGSVLYYRIGPGSDGILTVQLNAGPKQDLDLLLLDGGGAPLASSHVGLGETNSMEFAVKAGQTYYVAIAYYSGERGVFSLTAQVVPTAQAGDPFEPNNTQGTATPLAPVAEIKSRLDNPSDVDFFRISATQSGTLTVDMIEPANSDLDLQVLDQSGTILASSTNGLGMNEHAVLPMAQGQTLYVRVYYYSGRFPATYTLRTAFQPVQATPNPSTKPNNTLDQAAPLTNQVSGQIGSANDTAYYKWTAVTDGAAKFRLTMPSNVDLDLEVLDASGQVITASRNGLGMPELCTLNAKAGTTYYLHITYYSGSTPATFVLSQSTP